MDRGVQGTTYWIHEKILRGEEEWEAIWPNEQVQTCSITGHNKERRRKQRCTLSQHCSVPTKMSL